MKVLALDTSTEFSSIALLWDSSYEERLISKPFSPSEGLLHEIIEMLKRVDGDISDIDLFVSSKGPGSFTGLRVAISELKGFSLALDKPLVSVGTLRAIEKTADYIKNIQILSAIDGKKKRFYSRISYNGETLLSDSDLSPEDILKALGDRETLITGPDSKALYEKLKALGKENITLDSLSPRNLGRALIELGIEKFNKEGADDIGEGPMYIRKTDAEEALEMKKKND